MNRKSKNDLNIYLNLLDRIIVTNRKGMHKNMKNILAHVNVHKLPCFFNCCENFATTKKTFRIDLIKNC